MDADWITGSDPIDGTITVKLDELVFMQAHCRTIGESDRSRSLIGGLVPNAHGRPSRSGPGIPKIDDPGVSIQSKPFDPGVGQPSGVPHIHQMPPAVEDEEVSCTGKNQVRAVQLQGRAGYSRLICNVPGGSVFGNDNVAIDHPGVVLSNDADIALQINNFSLPRKTDKISDRPKADDSKVPGQIGQSDPELHSGIARLEENDAIGIGRNLNPTTVKVSSDDKALHANDLISRVKREARVLRKMDDLPMAVDEINAARVGG
jgi:hypothetical protein